MSIAARVGAHLAFGVMDSLARADARRMTVVARALAGLSIPRFWPKEVEGTAG